MLRSTDGRRSSRTASDRSDESCGRLSQEAGGRSRSSLGDYWEDVTLGDGNRGGFRRVDRPASTPDCSVAYPIVTSRLRLRRKGGVNP
jgi:hypothetical protein